VQSDFIFFWNRFNANCNKCCGICLLVIIKLLAKMIERIKYIVNNTGNTQFTVVIITVY
jgi:hypothetical protein